MGAFLQPPGLPLLRGGVIAVVVQEERPDLPADGRVDPTEENGLRERESERKESEREREKRGEQTFSGLLQKAAEVKIETQAVLLVFTEETLLRWV